MKPISLGVILLGPVAKCLLQKATVGGNWCVSLKRSDLTFGSRSFRICLPAAVAWVATAFGADAGAGFRGAVSTRIGTALKVTSSSRRSMPHGTRAGTARSRGGASGPTATNSSLSRHPRRAYCFPTRSTSGGSYGSVSGDAPRADMRRWEFLGLPCFSVDAYATLRHPRDRELPISSHLIYRPREGAVFGTVAGKSIRLVTLRSQAGMDMEAWRQAARSGGTVASNVTDWPKMQEIPTGVPAGAVRHRLTVAENAALEIYDYPGAYAQRFDGVGPGRTAGGSASHPHHGRVVWVKSPVKTGFPGGGFCIHGQPPCSNPRCIVIVQDWDSLFQALKTARQVSIVVEL
jgi:hypothetical protein